MKVYLTLLILNIILTESTDAGGKEDDENSESSLELVKEWPEVTFSSSEDSTEKKDPFWGHPIDDVVGSFENPPPNQHKLKHSKKNEEYDSNNMDEAEIKQYEAELKAGDMTQLFGTNPHLYQPKFYPIYDLGRRFVPQYPYQEVNQNDLIQEDEDPSLIPKQAPPELVLAIVKEAKLMQAAQPVDPNEHLLKKDSLRSGKYWNSYWQEDVEDPTNALRSLQHNKLDTVTAKLSPGTPIYEYVSKLNKLHPKLLYVINKTQ